MRTWLDYYWLHFSLLRISSWWLTCCFCDLRNPPFRRWLGREWRCTLNRLTDVHVECMYSRVPVRNLHALMNASKLLTGTVMHACGTALGIRSTEWPSLFLRSLSGITSSQKQRSEFSGHLIWSIYSKQNLEEGAASIHQMKKKTLRLAFPLKFSKHVRAPERRED